MAVGAGARVRLLALTLLLAASPALAAQEADAPRSRLWLGIGLAQGVSAEVEGGLGGMAQLTWQRGRHHAALRALGLGDFSSFPDGDDDSLSEVGLLYGRTRTASWGHAAAAVGVAAVRLDPCGDETPLEGCTTVGVPLTAEAALQTPVVGIGVQAYGNLNPEQPYGGLVLFVQLGWMP